MNRFMMRLISLISLFTVLIFLKIQAQNDEIIIIPYVTINDAPLTTSVLVQLYEVEDNMAAFNVAIEFVQTESIDEAGDIYLAFYPPTEAQLISNQEILLEVSPILWNRLKYGYWFNFDSSNDADNLNLDRNFLTATLLYELGFYEQAENLIPELIPLYINTKDSVSLEAFILPFMLGNINILKGDYANAVELYIEQAQFFPVIQGSFINRTWAMLQLGEQDLSALDYARTWLLGYGSGVNDVPFLSSRAQLYALVFDYDIAIEGMDEAITIAEENEADNHTLAELYTTRGEIIFLIYEWDRVEDNFDTAIELDPDYAPAYFQRGVLFYTMARRDDALADFETYLELNADGLHAEEAEAYIEDIH